MFKLYVESRVHFQEDVGDHGDCEEGESEERHLEISVRCKEQPGADTDAKDAYDL